MRPAPNRRPIAALMLLALLAAAMARNVGSATSFLLDRRVARGVAGRAAIAERMSPPKGLCASPMECSWDLVTNT